MEKDTIREKYIEYVLEKGEKPKSVFVFSKLLEISETDFYGIYSSFESIERDFWSYTFIEVLNQLKNDSTYNSYSSKDKLLAFYFLWVAKLRERRSFVSTFRNEFSKSVNPTIKFFDDGKKVFLKFAEEILSEGIEKREIIDRKYLSDKYKYGLWVQTIFILNYWLNDDSENFEMTDAAIEKTVSLAFKLIGDNTLDSLVDFGKFIFQKAV